MINTYKPFDDFIIDKICQPIINLSQRLGLSKLRALKLSIRVICALYVVITVMFGISGFFGWLLVILLSLAKIITTVFADVFIHIHANTSKSINGETPSIRETGIKDRFKYIWLYIGLEIVMFAVFMGMILHPHKPYGYSNASLASALILWTVTAILSMSYKWFLCCRSEPIKIKLPNRKM